MMALRSNFRNRRRVLHIQSRTPKAALKPPKFNAHQKLQRKQGNGSQNINSFLYHHQSSTLTDSRSYHSNLFPASSRRELSRTSIWKRVNVVGSSLQCRKNGSTSKYHIPIMCNEINEIMNKDQPNSPIFLDATFGEGGHSKYLLENNSNCKVVGIDKDLDVQPAASELQNLFPERFQFIHSSYTRLSSVLDRVKLFEPHKPKLFDGVLFDFGFNTLQVAKGERGFSLKLDGPLDMRFDQSEKIPSAADFVNTLSEQKLTKIFLKYGEERFANLIAKKIVAERRVRQIETTTQLADLVRSCYPPRPIWNKKRDPATLVFQALRIYVNSEWNSILQGLSEAEKTLKPGGKLCTLTFHSTEDQLVKRIFYFLAQHGVRYTDPDHLDPSSSSSSSKEVLESLSNQNSDSKIENIFSGEKIFPPSMLMISRRSARATAEEQKKNQRSRSALLRWCQRTENPPIGEVFLSDKDWISREKMESNK